MQNNQYSKAVKAELLKIKSTVAIRLALVYPLIPVLIYGIVMFYFQEKVMNNHGNTWQFFNTIVWNFWSSFAFLPLIGLQTILINNLENSNNGWRNLFSLPFPRKHIYMSKLSIVILLTILSLAALSIYVLLYGLICSFMVPQFGFQNYQIPLEFLYKPAFVAIGSLGVISVHYFLSVFVKNIYISFGAAIFFTIISLFLIQKENIAIYSPWSWGALSSHIELKSNGSFQSGMTASLLSIGLSIFVIVLGLIKEKSWNKGGQ